jgi:hypothetical protein
MDDNEEYVRESLSKVEDDADESDSDEVVSTRQGRSVFQRSCCSSEFSYHTLFSLGPSFSAAGYFDSILLEIFPYLAELFSQLT